MAVEGRPREVEARDVVLAGEGRAQPLVAALDSARAPPRPAGGPRRAGRRGGTAYGRSGDARRAALARPRRTRRTQDSRRRPAPSPRGSGGAGHRPVRRRGAVPRPARAASAAPTACRSRPPARSSTPPSGGSRGRTCPAARPAPRRPRAARRPCGRRRSSRARRRGSARSRGRSAPSRRPSRATTRSRPASRARASRRSRESMACGENVGAHFTAVPPRTARVSSSASSTCAEISFLPPWRAISTEIEPPSARRGQPEDRTGDLGLVRAQLRQRPRALLGACGRRGGAHQPATRLSSSVMPTPTTVRNSAVMRPAQLGQLALHAVEAAREVVRRGSRLLASAPRRANDASLRTARARRSRRRAAPTHGALPAPRRTPRARSRRRRPGARPASGRGGAARSSACTSRRTPLCSTFGSTSASRSARARRSCSRSSATSSSRPSTSRATWKSWRSAASSTES